MLIERCEQQEASHTCPQSDDWTNLETTIDQQEIEENIELVLHKLGDNSKFIKILHVGFGNSKFEERFAPQVQKIVALTVMSNEYKLAQTKNLPNCTFLICDKYTTAFDSIIEEFDIIVDNNPASYACCHFHYKNYLWRLTQKLKYKGVWYSHKTGISYIAPDDMQGYTYEEFVHDVEYVGFVINTSLLFPKVVLIAK